MSEPEPDARSGRVLAEYGTRMRRQRLVYFGIVGIVLASLAVLVAIAWTSGEANNTVLHVAATPAPSIAVATPSRSLTPSWHSTDTPAIGDPVYGGTVVTYSSHTVVGRDGLSGQVRWSYTRSDRTTCTAAQVDGATVAVYRDDGNCDEVTGLDSATGQRIWTRTLDEDGQVVNGTPSFAVDPTDAEIIVTTPADIYAIHADGPYEGEDVWTYSPAGCTIDSDVVGTTGALIQQDCTHPQCLGQGQTYCRAGRQLVFRSADAGYDSDDTKNPDQILWVDYGDADTPVSADALVSAYDPATGWLSDLDQDSGKTVARHHLTGPAVTGAPVVTSLDTDGVEIVWIDGTLRGLDETSGQPLWTRTAADAPSDLVQSGAPDEHLIVTVGPGHVRLLEPGTGRTVRDIHAPTATAAYQLGSGFVLDTSGTTTTT